MQYYEDYVKKTKVSEREKKLYAARAKTNRKTKIAMKKIYLDEQQQKISD